MEHPVSTNTTVTRAETDSDGINGFTAEITVVRLSPHTYVSRAPSPADLPDDIRQALLAWLTEDN